MNALKMWLYFSYLFFTGTISVKTLQDAVNASKDASKKDETATKWQSEKLEYIGSVTTEPQHGLNFPDFFHDREGLCIWGSFAQNVLEYVTGIIDEISSITAEYFDLKKNMFDSEISRELPKGYEFGLIEGLALILWLLLKQWGGKDGVLLNNGKANMFHFKMLNRVLVVCVSWSTVYGGWYVRDWEFDGDGQWSAGIRVFSCKAV